VAKLSTVSKQKLLQAVENAISFSSSDLSSAYGGDSASATYKPLCQSAAELSQALGSADRSRILNSIDGFEAALQSTVTISPSSSGVMKAQTNNSQVSPKELSGVLEALDQARIELDGGDAVDDLVAAADEEVRKANARQPAKKSISSGYLLFAIAVLVNIIFGAVFVIRTFM